MRAIITGVGNLCSKKGPVKVLGERRGLLARLRVRGEGKTGVKRLGMLIEVCKNKEGGAGPQYFRLVCHCWSAQSVYMTRKMIITYIKLCIKYFSI